MANDLLGAVALHVVVGAGICQLVSPCVLSALGIILLTFLIGRFSTWLLANVLPRRIIGSRSDKAVLITGCDSGFGHALAMRLDDLGFKVYAGCLNANGRGAEDLKAQTSDRLQLVPLDVTCQEQVDAAYQIVTTTLKPHKLWAVVNNAGIASLSEMEWCPIDSLKQILEVNTIGPVRVTQAFLPLLRETRGRVVIVASVAGRVVVPSMTAYSMSKFASVAFTDGLRRELKKWSVSVHSVEPAPYKTNLIGEQLFRNSKLNWERSSSDVKSSYGFDYFDDFQTTIRELLDETSLPASKIYQVVDDLVDAVAGDKPAGRYLPNMAMQALYGLVLRLPTSLVDYVIGLNTTKTLPAAVKKCQANSVNGEMK